MMCDMPNANSEVLRHRREELDLTGEELARRVGVSGGAYRNVELGRAASRRLLHRLARELDVPFTSLVVATTAPATDKAAS
jgi:transcriptional regulator with XRE-family HTH domain